MSEDLPFRAAVIQGVVNALKTITTENGYKYDLTDIPPATEGADPIPRVMSGVSVLSYDAPCPIVLVNESLENDDPSLLAPAEGVYDWILLVQGDVPPMVGAFPSLPAYHLLADVKHRLAYEICRKSPTNNDALDPLGMGSSSPLAKTGNCVQAMRMSRGIIRGPDLKSADAISPKAHFWMRLTLTISENAGNPYSYFVKRV